MAGFKHGGNCGISDPESFVLCVLKSPYDTSPVLKYIVYGTAYVHLSTKYLHVFFCPGVALHPGFWKTCFFVTVVDFPVVNVSLSESNKYVNHHITLYFCQSSALYLPNYPILKYFSFNIWITYRKVDEYAFPYSQMCSRGMETI